MAKLYGNIASSALMTFDKSFARANGQPLDSTEVYYSLEAAKTYAATDGAYIGQKIVVIENNVITHYSIEDAAGNLKELGSKPVGDNASIEVAEDGKISLFGFNDLTNEKVRYIPVTKLVGEDDDAHLEIEWVSEADIAPELTEGVGIDINGAEISAQLKDKTLLTEAANATAIGDETNYAVEAVRADKDGNLAVVLPKQPVIDLIKAEVGSAGHLKREIVEELPNVEEADPDTIYMIKANREVAGTLYTPYHRFYAEIGGSTTSFGFSETTDCISFDVTGGKTYTLTNVQFDTTADGGDQQYGAFVTAKDDYDNDTVLAHLEYDMPTTAPEGAARLFVNVNKGTMPTLIENVADVDQYREYMLVNGQFEQIGDTSVDLDGYATEEYVDGKVQEVTNALNQHKQEADNNYATKTALKEVSDNLANNYMDSNTLAATLVNYATRAELEEHEQYAEQTYAKAANVYTTDQIDTKIGTPGIPAEKDEDGNETKPAVPGTGVYEHVYSKTEVTDLIADITGGESAADVKAELKEYKTSNDAKIKTITDEIWGDETDFTKPSLIDKLAINVNVNTADITNLKKVLNGPNSNDGLIHKVATLEAEVYTGSVETESRIDGIETGLSNLSGTVGGHTAKFTQLESVTIPELSGRVSANETSVQNIQESIGTVPDGKTVIGLINEVDQKVGKIDLTPYALVTSVEEIYKKDTEGNKTGLLMDEIARATGAETALGERIDDALELIDGNTTAIETLIGSVEGDNTKSARAIATEVAKAEIGSAGHLKREIVDELPLPTDADPDTVYMIKHVENIEGRIYHDGNRAYTKIGTNTDGFGTSVTQDCVIFDVTPGISYILSNVQASEVLEQYGAFINYYGTAPGEDVVLAHINYNEPTMAPEGANSLILNVNKGTMPTLTIDSSGDSYREYMLIDGVFEQIGDTSVSLVGYATEKFVTSQGYITDTALIGYATEQFVTDKGYQNAEQVNALIDAKKYDLPIATATLLGGVLSAQDVQSGETTTAAKNAVYVDDATGLMTVKKITTDILTNGDNELVLFGGSAQ